MIVFSCMMSVSCEAIANVDAAIVACDAFGRCMPDVCVYRRKKARLLTYRSG